MPQKIANIPPLPERSKGALVKAGVDHTDIALLEFQSPTAALIGEPAPLSARMSSFVLTTTIIAFFAAMFFIKVDMVVTAPAVTVSHSEQTIVQPLETSVIRKILVKPGEQVKKDQLLAVLDPTFAGNDQTSTVAQMESLKAQCDRLRSELANKEYVSDGTKYSDIQAQMWQNRHANYVSQVESLKQTMEAARYKVSQFQADEKGFLERLPLAQQTEGMRGQLAKVGLDSQLNLLAASDARAQIQASLADTREQLKQVQHDFEGAMANLQAFVHQWYSDTSDLLGTQERSLSDMQSQANKNTLRAKLDELRSPVDGTVLNVSHISLGSVMQSGDELMRVVPNDSAIDVEGVVLGSDAGYIQAGDKVTVKFDTLPYLLYGYAFGKVTTVSSDSFSNLAPPQTNALPTLPNVGTTQAQNLPGVSTVSYVVRTSIDELKIHDVPNTFKIVPGMPITADIIVGKRSVFQYLFERIAPNFVEGMREAS